MRNRLLNIAGVAALAAIFGFGGAFAAVRLSSDSLTGPAGPRGFAGAVGQEGPQGPRGPRGGDSVEHEAETINELVAQVERLSSEREADRGVRLPTGAFLFMEGSSGRPEFGCPAGTSFFSFAVVQLGNGIAESSNLCKVD